MRSGEDIPAAAAGQYVALTSYKRDGTPVATPMWVIGEGPDTLAVWTVATSWKVKRIRRNPQVTVAPCTVRGMPLGPAVAGRAELLDGAETDRVREALGRKYGVMGRLTIAFSRLRRGRQGTVAIRVRLMGG